MKILVLVNKTPFPPKDGSSIATWNLCKGFSAFVSEVHILSFNTTKHFITNAELKNQHIPNVFTHTIPINNQLNWIRLVVNFLFSKKPYQTTSYYSKKYISQLKNLLSDYDFDMIHIEGLYMLQYINKIKEITNKPIAYRSHNTEFKIWEKLAANATNIVKKLYLKNLSKRIKKYEIINSIKCDYLIAISENDANEFRKMGINTNVFVSDPGIDIQEINPIVEFNDSLFFFGALDWIPNQEGLLWFLDDIWPIILKQFPSIKLTVAGKKPPYWLRKKVESVSNTIFLGEVTNKHSFLTENNFLISPLRSGSGVRIKILEAFSYGKIVLSTQTGANGLKISHANELFICNTAHEFIHSLGELKKFTPNDFMQMQQKAKLYVLNNFDTFTVAKRLLDYYAIR